jgi:hypothetical protein
MQWALPGGAVVLDAQPCQPAHFLNLPAQRNEFGIFPQACFILVL